MLSGGRCEIAFEKGYADPVVDDGDRDGDGVVLTTAAACKLVGGAWTGGHDISGHVFILVLGSAFLAYEVAPLWNRLSAFRERNSAAAKVDANPVAQGDEDEDERPDGVVLNGDAETGTVGLSLGFVAGVICTSLWMLLMTATYFHTWFEKVYIPIHIYGSS